MSIVFRCILAAGVLVTLVGSATAQMGGPKDPVTAVEKARLPAFCWKGMNVPNAEGPEFRMPPDCGPGTNHYCTGLVRLMRAKNASGNNRLALLRMAADDVNYTRGGIAAYPKCGLRDHVEASKAEVDVLLRIYGGAQSRTSGKPN